MYTDRGYPGVIVRVDHGFFGLVVLFGIDKTVRARGAVRPVLILVLLVDDLVVHCFGGKKGGCQPNRNAAIPRAKKGTPGGGIYL